MMTKEEQEEQAQNVKANEQQLLRAQEAAKAVFGAQYTDNIVFDLFVLIDLYDDEEELAEHLGVAQGIATRTFGADPSPELVLKTFACAYNATFFRDNRFDEIDMKLTELLKRKK